MKQLFTNWAAALLAEPISSTSTDIKVTAGFGALFPSPAFGEFFTVVLENEPGTVREIVRIAARTGDTLHVAEGGRGQEGTVANNWSTDPGTLVDHRVTAAAVRALQNEYTNSKAPDVKTFADALDHLFNQNVVVDLPEPVEEEPVGDIDGQNTIFVLQSAPIPDSETVYLNGMAQRRGEAQDYIIDGQIITFFEAPVPGDDLVVTYDK